MKTEKASKAEALFICSVILFFIAIIVCIIDNLK
ncbi:hypothetical protein BH10BAC1_BH10BAC1_11150 [soil metagenome]